MPRDGSNVFSAPAGTTATSGTTIESAKYNAFVSDLVADANLARPIVAGGTGATTAAAARTALGVQASDAALTSIAGLSWVADRYPYTTGVDTFALGTITAAGRAILDDADAAAQLVTLGAQPSDADLTAIAALGGTGIAVRTAANTWAQRTITSADLSVTITNPGGVAGDIDLSVASQSTELFGVLQANYTLGNNTTLQKLFNWSANGALTIPTGVYSFEIALLVSSMSNTSGNAEIGLLGAGTATLADIRYNSFGADSIAGLTQAISGYSTAVANSTQKAAEADTGSVLSFAAIGTFDVTVTGTLIPSIKLDTAAAAVVSAGSFFRCRKIGETGDVTGGTWS